MDDERARFAFAVTNVGSEAWLVDEVARLRPDARPSYRKRGLVTFKLESAADADDAEGALAGAIFARRHGRSLGLAADVDEARAKLTALPSRGDVRLHVFARDADEDGPSEESAARARAVEAALRAGGGFREGARAARGDLVVDVAVAEGEPLLVGTHVHAQGSPDPGGRSTAVVPEDAPSRAYAKLEEALAWSGLSLRPGERAIEIGSAPGGAAYALARRGVSVLGVDPGDMDPRVLAFEGPSGARVTHQRLAAGGLGQKDVPRGTTLVLCDVNLAPPVALRYVARLVSFTRPSLRAAILTLKLNDRRMVEAIPTFLDRVREMGLVPRATQLPSNRREICVVAEPTRR